MSPIRAAIEEVLREHTDAPTLSVALCVAIENVLDLDGNKWWDDDPQVEAAIEKDAKAYYERIVATPQKLSDSQASAMNELARKWYELHPERRD